MNLCLLLLDMQFGNFCCWGHTEDAAGGDSAGRNYF